MLMFCTLKRHIRNKKNKNSGIWLPFWGSEESRLDVARLCSRLHASIEKQDLLVSGLCYILYNLFISLKWWWELNRRANVK